MNPLHGISLKVFSVVVFTVMQVLAKAVAPDIPPGEVVFFRSFFALPVILVWLAWTHDLSRGLRVADPLGHVWRGLVGTAAMGLNFAALGFLPLPEVIALGYAAPILVVVFAAMFLGERVRAFRLICVGLGFLGVLVVLAPRMSLGGAGVVSTAEKLGITLVLTGAVCAALAQVFVRKLVNTDSTSAIVFWFSVTASLISLVTLPFGWVVPSPGQAALLVLAGLCGGVGQVLLTSAYRYADASVVAPFEYASMLFAIVLGYLIFSELPTMSTIAGASIIVVAGMLIVWREHKLGIERNRQRGSVTPQG